MQETRWDDGMKLTGPASMEDVKRALEDARNREVALHRPGSTVTLRDGSTYVVQPDGSWRRRDRMPPASRPLEDRPE